MSQSRRWTLATVAAVVVILVAGWFQLVLPKFDEASRLQDDAAAGREANAELRAQLEVLTEQAEGLDAEKAELARLTSALPGDPALPRLVRRLTATAEQSGADLVAISPQRPVALPGAAGAGAAATGTGVLRAVPLTLEVSGEYVQLERFMNDLEQVPRPLLVTGFTVGTADATEGAAEDTEATSTDATEAPTGEAASGSVTVSLTGRTYMLDRAGDPAATSPTASGAVPPGEGGEPQ
jgi:Tfp pilus assembly protein PilO